MPTLLCGSEKWITNKKCVSKILGVEITCLRNVKWRNTLNLACIYLKETVFVRGKVKVVPVL